MKEKANELKKLQDNAIGIRGIDYSADRVQHTGINNSMASVDEYVDWMRDIQKEYNRLAYHKRKIIHQIKAIEDPLYSQVLYLRYVNYMPWDRIAKRLGKSSSHIYRIHKDALEQFENKFLK